MSGRLRRAFLGLLKRSLNPYAIRRAETGRGPYSVIRHVSRRSGRVYAAPVLLAERPDGLVAERTYGDTVNWYRNIVAGGGEVLHRGRRYRIAGVEPLSTDAGLRAFGGIRAAALRLLRRKEFRLLRVQPLD